MTRARHTPEVMACAAIIGERIRVARKAAGLSTRAMGAALGVSAMAVSQWERGEVPLNSTRLIEIARVTGRKASSFLDMGRPTVTLSVGHWHRSEQ